MSDIKKDIKMKKEDLDKEVAKGDAERYLTDMKELPNYTKNDDDTSQDSLVVAEKQEKLMKCLRWRKHQKAHLHLRPTTNQ